VSTGGGVWLRALRRVGRILLRVPRPVALLFALAWAAMIWGLSATAFHTGTGNPVYGTFANLAHAPLFGVLALLLSMVLVRAEGDGAWPRPGAARLAAILALCGLYGLVDEWHQGHTPGRDVSVADVATDLTGAACVLWIVAYLARPGASEPGLRRRLVVSALLCVVPAAIGAWS
jgi:VanZ family protein